MTLDLLARAVSGVQVEVLGTDQDRAFVDGATIALPTGLADPVPSLIVQAALLAIGSLTPNQVKALRRAGAATVDRYLVLEATRAAAVPWLLPRRITVQLRALGAPATTSAAASLELARSGSAVPAAPEWLGAIHPALLTRHAAPELADDAEAEASRLLELLSPPLDSPLTRLMRMLGGGTRLGGGGTGLETGGRATGRPAPTEVLAGDAKEVTRGGVQVTGTRYPEWDCHRAELRAGWCTVYDLDPTVRSQAPLPASPDAALRRQLARIGSAPQRRRNLREGDSLDSCGLVEHMVQRRLGGSSGGTDDPRVFEARTWTARDLGVLVLLDATGSTSETADGRSVFDDQREVVHRLAGALAALGDRTAVYAFNSRGRHDVRFLRVKEFDGRYDEAARARLAAVRPGDFTRLGAAVRHGTRLLGRQAGTSHLLLVVVGDGLPYDDGYEERYAREDSRAALRGALAAGVGCVSIGVGTSMEPRVVEEVWGEVTHLHLAGPEQLERSVRDAFGSALKLATARRRAP